MMLTDEAIGQEIFQFQFTPTVSICREINVFLKHDQKQFSINFGKTNPQQQKLIQQFEACFDFALQLKTNLQYQIQLSNSSIVP